MIVGWLKGRVISTGADTVLIDTGGVGYVANAGSRLLSKLAPGEMAEVHVETKVTDSSIQLYAFATDDERAWFVRLQDVPGVGGKAAMAVLDALTVADLMDAIALGDSAVVMRAKGVGKKLAERIVGEMTGKPPPLGRFGAFAADPSASVQASDLSGGARGEAVSALTNLGYGQSDAARAVAAAARNGGGDDVGGLVKAALKELSQ